MAVWRRRALEAFPQLRRDLNRGDYTVYALFFDLLPMARAAHEAEDDDMLRRIYAYAEWCARQTAKDLWNAAGVCFYEHLFDLPDAVRQVIPWLSPFAVFTHWGLFEWMVPAAMWLKVRPLLEAKRVQGEHEWEESRTCAGGNS